MYYFIVNKYGGTGKAAMTWNIVHSALINRNIVFKAYLTKYKGHASKIAAHISSLKEDDIRMVVVGGDGTINEVINGIRDFDNIKFGIIPTGSGNDFARGLKLPKDPEKVLDMILDSDGRHKIDIGRITCFDDPKTITRFFGISCGIGMDAIVCKKVDSSSQKKFLNKLHLGGISYKLMTIETLFSMKQYRVTITDNAASEKKTFSDLIFLAGMNFPAEGGGVPMAPLAKADDGLISFCAVNGISRICAFFILPLLIKGKHKGHAGIHLFDSPSVTIESEEPMVLHTDGEYINDVTHLTIDIFHNALSILIND